MGTGASLEKSGKTRIFVMKSEGAVWLITDARGGSSNNPNGLLNTFYPDRNSMRSGRYRYDGHFQTEAEI